MAIKSIVSRAPTRIDLAGGTLDLWPLYLLAGPARTINLGINLYAEAELKLKPTENSQPGGVLIQSKDQNQELRLTAKEIRTADLYSIKVHPAVELHTKLLIYFAKQRGGDFNFDLTLNTSARSPAGAGLGGSSTLCIAMIGALASWAQGAAVDPLRDGERLIEIAKDIETTVIKVPAGVQDYYGAMFGGLQSIAWQPGSHLRKWLSDEAVEELEDRILLFYSGQSRNSGINNWVLYKTLIDRDAEVQKKFEKIAAATTQLEAALKAKDWKATGDAIAEEWETRKTLASGITTPEIDLAFAQARKIAPVSGKVCGAGGGGCFFLYLPTENKEERTQQKNWITQALQERGILPLPFRSMRQGLEVKVERA